MLRLACVSVLALFLGGCGLTGANYDDSRSSGGSRSSTCVSCRGSGRCNTCNGTGRFLGSGQTTCSTCSASGVCINCGGRGSW